MRPSARAQPPARGAGRRPLAPRFAALIVFILLLTTPFVVSPSRADAFDLPKLLASEWLGLASLVALAWRLRATGEISLGRLWAVPALAAVVPLLAVATAGLALSPHPVQVRAALPSLWIGAACLVGWSAGLSLAAHRRLLLGLLAPASLLALLAVLQFHDLYRPFAFSRGEQAERLGVTSLAGNAGVLAAYLVLPALIAQASLYGAWRHSRPKAVAAAVALALCLYGIAVTQTLAALAAVAVGSIVLWTTLLPSRRAAVALAAAAAVAVAGVAAVPPLRARVVTMADRVAAGDWNLALTGRLDGWRAAAWMTARHPVTGVGHGAFEAEFVPARLAAADRGVRPLAGVDRAMFVNAHNEFLEAAAEWGVAGLAALGWGLWCLGVRLWRMGSGRGSPASSPRAADRALALAGVAALTLVALAHFPFRVAVVGYPAVLFLAWIFHHGGEGER